MAAPATDPHGPTGRVATWLADLRHDAVPAPVLRRARYVLLDAIGCALVGARLPWSRTAAAAVLSLEAGGPATVVGWDRSVSAPAAALLNGTFIQAFELDDYHAVVPIHTCAVTLPAVLACAEHRGAVTGREALVATVAGFEIGPRAGMALGGLEMLSRGWHSGAVFGTLAAAAAAGVLLGLDAARFEDALGLAATQSCGLMAAQYESMVKRMHHGMSARGGLFAAVLAAGGYTGIKRVIEREYGGYVSTFAPDRDVSAAALAADALGKRWETERICIKPYATMAGLHPAIEAVLALRAVRPFGGADVEHIDVEVGDAVFHHGGWRLGRPATVTGAQMNLGYAVAAAVVDGEVTPRQFLPARLQSGELWAVLERVCVHRSERDGLATQIAVRLRDGTALHTEVEHARGGSARPLAEAEIVAKFRGLVAGAVTVERARRIERLVLALDALDDVGELVAELRQPTATTYRAETGP